MTSTAPVTTGTLAVPDGSLYYEVRGTGPLVVLIGAPMGTAPFAAAAELLATDHTVLTADPRGHDNSYLDDPDSDSTPELRADDLARLITHIDAGPAVVFGSSGGAVTALALTQSRPDLVHTLIAHEPPLLELLQDRAELRAATADMIATYLAGDPIGGWRKFFAIANIAIPDPALEQMFGGERDKRTVESERYWFEHEYDGTVAWVPDIDTLRAAPTHIIIGLGEASTGQFCDYTSRALATALAIDPTMFPGGHTDFAEDPAAFDKRLREVLRDK